MVMKLQRAGAAASAEPERAAPKGWGQKAAVAETTQAETKPATKGWGKPAAVDNEPTQAELVEEKLTQGGEAQDTSAFSGSVAEMKAAIEGDESPFDGSSAAGTAEAPKATRTRAAKDPTPPASGLSIQDIKDAVAAALVDERDFNGANRVHHEPSEEDKAERAAWDAREIAGGRANMLATLVGAAHTAANTIMVLSSAAAPMEAVQSVYDLMFSAIEAEMLANGFTTAE